MSEALGWVGKLFEFVASLFPRLLVVEATHGGVAFVRGKNVKLLGPGLHIYWPFWTEISVVPTVRQTVKLPSQALTTLDGKRVCVGGMVRFRIRNVKKALAGTWDLDGAIIDESLVVLSCYVTSRTYDALQQDRDTVNAELTECLQEKLTAYGVRVMLLSLTDFSGCTTLNHVVCRAYTELPTGE